MKPSTSFLRHWSPGCSMLRSTKNASQLDMTSFQDIEVRRILSKTDKISSRWSRQSCLTRTGRSSSSTRASAARSICGPSRSHLAQWRSRDDGNRTYNKPRWSFGPLTRSSQAMRAAYLMIWLRLLCAFSFNSTPITDRSETNSPSCWVTFSDEDQPYRCLTSRPRDSYGPVSCHPKGSAKQASIRRGAARAVWPAMDHACAGINEKREGQTKMTRKIFVSRKIRSV